MTREQYLDEWRSDRHHQRGAACRAVGARAQGARFGLSRAERAPLSWRARVCRWPRAGRFAITSHPRRRGDPRGARRVFAGSLFYCFARAAPYAHSRVAAPTFAFDYVLYLGCLTFAAALGYIDIGSICSRRVGRLSAASALLYFALAYRFDNRFVLSLALSTLAGMVRRAASRRGTAPATVRGSPSSTARRRRRSARGPIAPDQAHFLETYLHVAANAVCSASPQAR